MTCPRLAVLADDLTGAGDAAAAFASAGARVVLPLTISDEDRRDIDVLALCIDTRWRPPSDCRTAVRVAVERVRRWGATQLFVKIDSTLRGDVATFVASAVEAWGGGRAIVAPAFPMEGRTVRGGQLLVAGKHARVVAEALPLGMEVADAESDEDLRQIVERIRSDGAVAVGSAGLARALAGTCIKPMRPTSEPGTPPARGVLLVVGTAHPRSRTQAAAAARVVDAAAAIPQAEDGQLVAAKDALMCGGRVLLALDLPVEAVPLDSPAAERVVRSFVEVAVPMLESAPRAGVVVTGGATALALARALDASEFRIRGEVAAGVPFGVLQLPRRIVPTTTKSGGFGRDSILLEAASILEGNS